MVASMPNLGIDPFTALTVGGKVLDFLGNTFGGPTAAQVAAQQAAAAAAQRRTLYVAGGIVGAALLVALLVGRGE